MDQRPDLKCAIQRLVAESKKALAGSEVSAAEVESTVEKLLGLMPSQELKDFPVPSGCSPLDVQTEFMKNHYTGWLEWLADNFCVEWMQRTSYAKVVSLLNAFFLQGTPHEAFMVLTDTISNTSASYRLHKCVSLLETFLKIGRLQQVLWEQCTVDPNSSREDRVDPDTLQLWQQIATHIVALPDRILAKLHKDASALFYPKVYIALVTKELLLTLRMVTEKLATNQDCSVQFLCQLFGRLCLAGHADTVWEELLPSLVQHVQKDFVWCRVCERLVSGVPDRCLEATVTALLKHSPWYGVVSKLLGHSVLTNSKLQYLLCNKFLLLRYFSKDLVLQNIFGYLSASPATRHLLKKTWLSMLDVWGDASAVRHTSYEQHLYVTKALLVCLAFQCKEDKASLTQETLSRLMPGVQCHLDSPIMRVRRLAMVLAEQVTAAIGPQEHKLSFEYEADEEVRLLKDLVLPPVEPNLQDLYKKADQISLGSELPDTVQRELVPDNREEAPGEMKNCGGHSELDSDDDLEPFDLSHDVEINKVKSAEPLYLRDCMEGLLNNEDPNQLEACLGVAEKLVRQHSASVKEVATEFAKILLHLQDNTGMAGFMRMRFSALVALGVTAPKEVAEYLTEQFYDRNYNIRQRMDILEVLASVAQELSQPATGEAPTQKSPAVEVIDSPGDAQNWRQIVQQRIDRKTRRFGRGRQNPKPEAVANRFAPVAGYFFFPLLKFFDRKENTLDLLGTDHLVLSRLIYTLGILTYAALHAPAIKQIAKALLDFIWVLHCHPQPAVRQALLYAFSMVLLVVPSAMLFSDFEADLTELKSWLADAVEKDPDTECQKLSLQALILLQHNLKKEFELCS